MKPPNDSDRDATLFDVAASKTYSSVDAPDTDFDSQAGCSVIAVGKRRDGGTRYWCLRHKADATAKYGKPAQLCRGANISPISIDEIFTLDIDQYAGGVAMWGAVPPVYDTTTLPMDRGIHLHARRIISSSKEVDRTFRGLRILGKRLPKEGIFVSELDSIYYMVSSVMGLTMSHVTCSYCEHPHLDKDWFSVHPHRRHLCAGCGKYFRDDRTSVGNPIVGIREACGISAQTMRPSEETLDIQQSDFPTGIQIWGSNPALLWTSPLPESEGIHVHAFKSDGWPPHIDETFREVTVDGVVLDPQMVRVLMAQESLPSLRGRVIETICPICNQSLFEDGDGAFAPSERHICKSCGVEFASKGRLRKVVGNPLVGFLARLAKNAPRVPQQHDLGLLPETLLRVSPYPSDTLRTPKLNLDATTAP
jgi:transposase-like protein